MTPQPFILPPGEGGLNPAPLLAAHQRILRDLPDVTSLLVARAGRLAFEAYFQGGPEDARDVQSVTKSVLSLLVGAALGQGHLQGLDQPVLSLLPELAAHVVDDRWTRVTVRHLLTMTSGLPSELTDEAYDEAYMAAPDPVRFAVGQRLAGEPGADFRYSNAGAHLLGAALARVVGQDLAEYAQANLFTPLGVPHAHWTRDPQGRPMADGGLRLRSRDVLRVGQLVLQRGGWAGQRLVPAGWIADATRPHVPGYVWMEGLPDYGLLWWVTAEGGAPVWYATGFGGQYLAVFPELDAVAVMTGVVGVHPSHRFILPEFVRAALV